jgi:hypothetical protein
MADSAHFELRTYTANEGKLDALLTRFRDHTLAIFASHQMESVGYWIQSEIPNTLLYVLRHTGDPKDNWAAMQADPIWITAKAASEVDGPLVARVDSIFMTPTDFSAIS